MLLPTYGSWLDWIEAKFAALRYCTLNGTDLRSHTGHNAVSAAHMRWRNARVNFASGGGLRAHITWPRLLDKPLEATGPTSGDLPAALIDVVAEADNYGSVARPRLPGTRRATASHSFLSGTDDVLRPVLHWVVDEPAVDYDGANTTALSLGELVEYSLCLLHFFAGGSESSVRRRDLGRMD